MDGSGVGIEIERRGATAVIVLNRPAAGNAVTSAMRAKFSAALDKYGRDPIVYGAVIKSAVQGIYCSGLDVAELAAARAGADDEAAGLIANELTLFWKHECFFKPSVAFIDGAVRGGGIGYALFGTHRVATQNFELQLPQTSQGLVPSGGILLKLAHMPAGIGRYLAFTGRSMSPADAYALGLVTHCIPSERFPGVEEAFADADPIDPLLDGHHIDPGPSPLLQDRERIERYFRTRSLTDLLAALQQASGDDAAWASDVLAKIPQRNRLALALTDEALLRAAHYDDIHDALIDEHRVLRRLLAARQPADPEELPSPAAIAAYFAPGPGDLALPSRSEVQSRAGA